MLIRQSCFVFMVIMVLAICSCIPVLENDSNGDGDGSGGLSRTLTLSFAGPDVTPDSVYVAWLEDEAGVVLANVYVCSRLVSGLTGTPLPHWNHERNGKAAGVDGVTGASSQPGTTPVTLIRVLRLEPSERVRVCFEIDRSKNGNNYFEDRPAFIYKTDLFEWGDAASGMHLSLRGWMANDTASSPYSQQPTQSIPRFEQYKFMSDTSYIAPLGDMVDSLIVSLE